MKTYKAVENILNNVVLAGFQSVDLVRMWVTGVVILVYSTGLGKTLMAAAFMKGHINRVPSTKFIYVVKAGQLLQTPDKIRKYTGLKVAASSAAGDEISGTFFESNFLDADVLIITHNLLANDKFMRYFHQYKDRYSGIILDEVHELANFPESASGAMARAMLRNYPIRVGLTATPVTKSRDQLVRLAHMFDWEKIDDVRDFTQDVKRGDDLLAYVPDLFIFRDRATEGISGNYRTHIEEVEPHEWQIGANGWDMFDKTKGPNAYNQANRVISIYNSITRGIRGIVFVHYQKSAKWLTSRLEEAGIVFEEIYGPTSRAERDKRLKRFNSREVDLLITSVEGALDMDAEYVIFYEYTGNVQQMLGRAERGLNPKTLDLYFIFTLNTGEADYFLRNTYEISFWINQALSQDYSTICRIGESLKYSEG